MAITSSGNVKLLNAQFTSIYASELKEMRIVLLSEFFAKHMGYLGSMLPRQLASLGYDVHVLTLDLPPYYQIEDFSKTYGSFSGAAVPPAGTVEEYDGYTLHVLPHKSALGHMWMPGLLGHLRRLKPDIVQTFVPIGWIPLQAALARPILGFKLFTGAHTTASVFPLAKQSNPRKDPSYLRSVATRAVPGRLVSLQTEICFAATDDCADVAIRFFGVQREKVEVCPLGVDTNALSPGNGPEDRADRHSLRVSLGFADNDIVCIYTGRFSNDKNPLLLAKAVEKLRAADMPFRGLFVGGGTQEEAIGACTGCVTRPFVPFADLPRWFRAAEIGVWPTQESTSMLDAAACGLPIVVNDTLVATERIQGNGLTYRLGDVDDLVRVLATLQKPQRRSALGETGARRMKEEFSWSSIARRRSKAYEAASASRESRSNAPGINSQ